MAAPQSACYIAPLTQPWNRTLEHDPESQRCQVWHCLDVPGYGLGGFLDYYWTVDADIDRWNGELFRSQAATMTELTCVLIASDLDAIAPARPSQEAFSGSQCRVIMAHSDLRLY
jgi:hypothetical protein